ncbi:MAG: helicase-associated domain-containing protein [Anaerolineales bacterium]|nr:helicase-associated domain-containing protein [Anaerolineales bacterium]
MNLHDMLDEYRANVIKAMVEGLGDQPHKYKSDNLQHLVQAFPQAERVAQALKGLNETERLVLAYLQQRNGRMWFQRLQRLLMTAHNDLFKPSRITEREVQINGRGQPLAIANPTYRGKPTFEDVIAGLALKGLVFSEQPLDESLSVVDWLHGRFIYIPQYVRKQLKRFALPELPERNNAAPPHIVTSSARAFQRNLSRFGRFVRRRGEVGFTTQGLLYKNDLRELDEELSFVIDTGAGKKETDNGQFHFMRRLLPAVGLTEPQRYDAADVLIGRDEPELLQLPLAERVASCFMAWRDGRVWHELAQLNHYESGINISHHAQKEFAQTRQTVLEHMAGQPGEWIALDDLVDDIREEDYGFLFVKRELRGRYDYYRGGYQVGTAYQSNANIYGANFKNVDNEADGWNKVEADLINHIIAGPLFWMGLVDLGYTKEPPVDLLGNKPVDLFRLTPYGRWLIKEGEKPAAQATEGGNVIVQPTFEIVVMGPMGDDVLMSLDLFARSQKEQEHVSTFVLDKESVYQAQKLGWPVPRIIAYLEELSSRPLPQNVRRSLEEWGALQERIVIRRSVRLLETADEETAVAVEQDLADASLRRVLPTVFVSDWSAEQLAKRLDEARWIPLRTRPRNTTAHNSIRIDGEGNIQFTQPTPSIFARQILRGISVQTDHGRKLTKPLVKSLVGDGPLDGLLVQLQQLNRGQLPHQLIVTLKAWTDYYGNAQQGTVTLIEFESEQIRDELVHDEALRDYLRIFPAAGRALAIVHPDFVKEVNQILVERGIEIGQELTE